MKALSKSFLITRREIPKDEKTLGAKLLLQSEMVYKNDNGIYSYMPFGLRVVNNISKIIREEMERITAEEVLMPSLVNEDIFKCSSRLDIFDNERFIFRDRNDKELTLCPTHEELFSILAKNKIQSYKDLHFSLFQISNKFRDEFHSEYGLIRKKEFYMADAYSFDANDGGLDISYDKMFQAFSRIFDKIGINTIVVNASADDMNGLSSEEFQVISEYGDNEVVKCTNCSFTRNREDVVCKNISTIDNVKLKNMELVKTPNARTVKEVSDFLECDTNSIIKSLIVKVDESYKMILLRGESELNLIKLYKILKTRNIEIPSEQDLERIGTYAGYVGPINSTMQIIADNEVKYMMNGICGANKKNYHYKNVVPGRDFRVNKYADLKLFDENSVCPKCKSKCEIIHGIEVGHIFKLGDSFSQDYSLKYTDESNMINYVHMGSYGIGIDRCVGTIVEQNHDDRGIIWPLSVAPYKVGIIIVNVNDVDAYKYAFDLGNKLDEVGIDCVVDDRKDGVGVKFADLDLIGIPIRVTVGNSFKDGKVEIKLRDEDNLNFVNASEVVSEIQSIIKSRIRKYE